jgi:hypothetical protein
MRCALVVVGLVAIHSSSVAFAQQVTVTTPATTVTESFSERVGVGFNLNHPNFSLGFGGPGRGGFGGGGFSEPLDGLSVGIPLRGGRANGNLSITAGQSFSRGVTTTAPTITVMNGVPGFVFGGTLEPFVTRLNPVVGAGMPANLPAPVSRVRSLLDSGEVQVKKDADGNTRLVINEPAPRRPRAEPEPEDEPVRAKSDSSNSFRRALEKYAGPKQ